MKLRIGAALLAGGVLLLGAGGCANPETPGADVSAKDVGPEVRVAKDAKIAAMVPDTISKKGSFTASINPDVAPIKFIDSDGEFAGLVPDLLDDAATVMGIKIELQRGAFDSMVPGLESKRFDVIASVGDFKQRQKKIDFIDYLQTGTAILTSTSFGQDKITPADLCGLSVAYARGTAQQGLIEDASKDCLKAGKKKVTGTGYGDSGSALLSVKSGQADAFWGDSPAMLYNAKTSPKLYKVVYEATIGPYGIGINKDNTEFRDALRAALLELVDSGAYDQLLEKWGQQDYGMPKMPLNTGPSMAEE